jgi:hypothetical protein
MPKAKAAASPWDEPRPAKNTGWHPATHNWKTGRDLPAAFSFSIPHCHGPQMRATQFTLYKWCRTQLGGPHLRAMTMGSVAKSEAGLATA